MFLSSSYAIGSDEGVGLQQGKIRPSPLALASSDRSAPSPLNWPRSLLPVILQVRTDASSYTDLMSPLVRRYSMMLSGVAPTKTLQQRNLQETHFHFMVHPTGTVSVVSGLRPSRTASRASLK